MIVFSMRNLGDFSGRDCTFESRDFCEALSRHIHVLEQYLLGIKNGTLFEHVVHGLTVYATRS